MAQARLKQSLHRFLNSCAIIFISLVLIVIIATAAIGIHVNAVDFPELLGNSPDNIGHIKLTTDPNEFTFVVVGDVKCGTATFEAMLNIISQDKPAFVVILGDFVEHAELISHKLFALEMAEYAENFPILLVPGNHDISADGPFRLKDFENTYGPAQFSFTAGSSLFVFLNVISPYGQTGQYLEFLEQTISGQPETPEKIFVFMHIPPSSLNSSVMSSGLPNSENFLRLAKKYHVNYVFAGDHHGYVKTEKDGTVFIVSGGGGAKLRGEHGGFHHLVRISVKDSMSAETVVVARKQPETLELIERNLVVYIWPLITRNLVSAAATFVFFGLAAWSLIISLRRRKYLVR